MTNETAAEHQPAAASLRAEWVLAQRSPRTRETYDRVIGQWFNWCQANNVSVLDARRRDVDAYRHYVRSPHRLGGPIAEETEAQHLATLSSFYKYASEEGPIEINPVANVRRPKIANISRRHFLTLEEARTMLAASIAAGPRSAALVHLLLSTGARVSEVCNADCPDLGWTDDGERALIVVRKGGRRGELPILGHYWTVIEAYLLGRPQGMTGPVLATTHGRMVRQTAYQMVREIADTVTPTKTIGPHSLRHTAATLALDDGIPIQEVQGMLGHSEPRTTSRYDRHRNRRGAAAFRSVGDLLKVEQADG